MYSVLERLLLLAHHHAAVVKHAAHGVVERQAVLAELLGEDVDLVLEQGALLAQLLVGHAAVVAHLGAELGAGGAEEVRLVVHVGLADEPALRHVQVRRQQVAHRLHGRDGLPQRVATC